MYSVMIARYKYYPEVKTKGMSVAPRLVLFTSEHVGDGTHTHTSIMTVLMEAFSKNAQLSMFQYSKLA